MTWNRYRRPEFGGAAPATPGFNAVAPEWLVSYGAATAAPVIPAAESTLGFHPWRALSSAQVVPEWINRNLAGNASAANGDYPLNFVSHSKGSLQVSFPLDCGRNESVSPRRFVVPVRNTPGTTAASAD